MKIKYTKSIPDNIKAKALVICTAHNNGEQTEFRKSHCHSYFMCPISLRHRIIFRNGVYHCMTHEQYNGIKKKKRM